MRQRVLIGLLLIQACASGPPAWTPAARLSPASCTAPGVPAAEPWQLVAGDGFTFCVPADWHTSDGRTWRGGGGSITWGTGAPPPGPVISGEVVTRVPVGQMPSQGSLQAAAEAQVRARCSVNRFTERVGGLPAALHDTECDGRHFTGARWETPGVYLQGEAGDAWTASLQLLVYRTVRFAPTGGH
jgi:hypothetical protein